MKKRDMRLLIGTSNPGKAREFRKLLEEEGFETVTLDDLELGSVEETGETFEDNASLKASTYAAMTGMVTIADDGGLEIDALDGAPGVRSRRWAGEDATDLDLAHAVIDRLRGIPAAERTARLRTVIAVARPDGRIRTATSAIEGVIADAFEPRDIIPGYPYRSLFRVDGYDKLFCELTDEEHREVNHRRAAMRMLFPYLRSVVTAELEGEMERVH